MDIEDEILSKAKELAGGLVPPELLKQASSLLGSSDSADEKSDDGADKADDQDDSDESEDGDSKDDQGRK